MRSASRALLAEFAGTAALLAIVIGSGIMGDRLSGGNDAIALLANALATGAGLYVLIVSLGPISGAHFNPLVTLMQRLHGETIAAAWPLMLLAQFAGAVIGVWLAHAMCGAVQQGACVSEILRFAQDDDAVCGTEAALTAATTQRGRATPSPSP